MSTTTVQPTVRTDTTWLRLISIGTVVAGIGLVVLALTMTFWTTTSEGAFQYTADYWLTAPALPIGVGLMLHAFGVHHLQHGRDGRLGTIGVWMFALCSSVIVIQCMASLAASAERNSVVVNALGPQFHKGLEPSRYGRPGRVPGSCNVSAATLYDPQTKAFVPLAEAEKKFAAQGITKDKRAVAYCGGGISATIDLFMLHRLGYDNLTLYDGSMGEWAKDESLPIETG